MSFSESLNQCLCRSIPAVFLTLSGLAMFFARRPQPNAGSPSHWPLQQQSNATESALDYTRNDLLIGSPDAFFWFLLPSFGVISVGLCIAINYTALSVTYIFTIAYTKLRASVPRSEDGR